MPLSTVEFYMVFMPQTLSQNLGNVPPQFGCVARAGSGVYCEKNVHTLLLNPLYRQTPLGR